MVNAALRLKSLPTHALVLYNMASHTFLFCDPILEMKFVGNPRMSSLRIHDIKAINLPLQAQRYLNAIFCGGEREQGGNQ